MRAVPLVSPGLSARCLSACRLPFPVPARCSCASVYAGRGVSTQCGARGGGRRCPFCAALYRHCRMLSLADAPTFLSGCPWGPQPCLLGHPFLAVVARALVRCSVLFCVPVSRPAPCRFADSSSLAALWAVTIAEIIIFTLCGAIMYHYIGASPAAALARYS